MIETNIDRFEIFRQLDRGRKKVNTQYRYRAVGGNGEILFGGEAHTRKEDAHRALQETFGAFIDENNIEVRDMSTVAPSKYRVEGIPEDEPVFVLRAQDRAAAQTIDAYVDVLADLYDDDTSEYIYHSGHPMVRGVKSMREEFDLFAHEHPERMKNPD